MRVFFVGLVVGCAGGDEVSGGAPGGDPGPETPTGSVDSGTDDPPDVDADADGHPASVDCDDADSTVFPGAPDVCGDGRVTDCDRTSDDGLVNLDGVGFDALQDALDAASPGSEVLLCPGTYEGNFAATVPVRIVALEDASTTALSGPKGTVLTVIGGSEVSGLTIRDGIDGGLRIDGSGTLTVTGCTITLNRALDGGGLQIAADVVATLVDTEVTGNAAMQGGGGAWLSAGATLDLTQGSSVTDNRAGSFGGGVWLDGAHLVGGTLSGNAVDAPQPVGWDGLEGTAGIPAIAWGGTAVAMVGDASVTSAEVTGNTGLSAAVSAVQGSAVLQDVSIHDNVGEAGGGVAVIAGTLTLLGDTEVVGNQAAYGAGGFAVGGTLIGGTFSGGSAQYGGGVEIYGGELRDATIADNTAVVVGGGIHAVDAAVLVNLTVTGNVAADGGGLFVDRLGDPPLPTQLIGGTVSGNDAGHGGAVMSVRALAVTDATIVDNTAVAGAGLFLRADATLGGGTVARNVAMEGAGGVELIGAWLEAAGVDFGEGADDNLPSDVVTADGGHTYGADATFSCDATTCD